MTDIKLCKDCKWRTETFDCIHESAMKADYVNGLHEYYSCWAQRNSAVVKDCGPDGKFWEGK